MATSFPFSLGLRSALAVVGPLILIGFSGCSDSRTAGVDGSAQDGAASAQPAAVDYVVKSTGVPGGTLEITAPRDLTTIDLQRTSGPRNGWYGRLLFDCLVYLDEQGRPQPWLAKSWTISPDGKTYTFILRDDVSFSDGTRFDAEAVRVNLDRIRDPATKAAVATAYIEPYLRGEVVDTFTFRAQLSEPYEPFLRVLALAIFGLYSPKQILNAPGTLAEAPIGSGPFVVENYVPQQSLTFLKRKDYHWAPPYIRHEGPAYLDRIVVRVIPDFNVSSFALRSGQYDMVVDAQPQIVPYLKNDTRFFLSGRVLRGNPVSGPVFNLDRAPFDRINLRRAIAHAIDREGLVQLKSFGLYPAKSDFLAANTAFYDGTSPIDAPGYDPAVANALLDTEGWTGRDREGYRTKNGKRLSAKILQSSATTSSADLVVIQSDLRKIGFELVIEPLPAVAFASRRSQGDYDLLSSTGLHTNTPDALFIYYHSSQIPHGQTGSHNVSRLRDARIDELLSSARKTTDAAALASLYGEAQHRLVDLLPAIPLHENTEIVVYNQTKVKGVIYDTSHDLPYLISAWLSASSGTVAKQ